jgi:hypothetical protein
MSSDHARHGLDALRGRPLLDTIFQRRTHRVSRGSDVTAGEMSYKSAHPRAPLSPLEEALLIATTGCTGLTMPDRPFFDPRTNAPIMAKPNVNMAGRTAGSPDNAQGTYFFMINDSGTYFLRNLPPVEGEVFDPDLLLKQAELAKVKLLDRRIDVPNGNRDFPAYLDSNRFLSNLPGTTVLFPVVDLSHQYINGMMYLLTQPAGARPAVVDDRNFYQLAGVKKWVKNGFLNKDIKVPLGVIWSMRTQIEADYVTPKWKLADILRWQVPLPKYAGLRANPVGLRHKGEHLIKGCCPPYYDSMSEAVDAVVAAKFGPKGIYQDKATFDKIYRERFGTVYLKEASVYSQDVIECTRDICNYIYQTHGRFPSHVDAIHAPGIWLQIHHVEQDYYDTYFNNGLTQSHRDHDRLWHPVT